MLFRSHAVGSVVVKQDDVTLLSDRAVYEQVSKIVRLKRNVKVKKESLLLHCDEAVAYEAENEIHALGNVSFNYQDIRGTSKEVKYDLDEKRVILVGDPVVRQGEDLITGETIWVDLEYQRILTKGNAKVKLSSERIK